MGSHIPLLMMLGVRAMDNSSHWCGEVWEVISTITQIQTWAPGMDEGT